MEKMITAEINKNRGMVKQIIILISSLFFISLFFGCSPNYTGYGVILWSDNPGEYKNGEVVGILSTSKLNDAYYIYGKDKKTKLMLPMWRTEYFKSKKEAVEYADQYSPYAGTFVYSTQEGIPPVREEAGNSSSIKIVYKFKENQMAKVLGISDEKVTISKMEANWYHVLLENKVPLGGGKFKSVGIKGYCFGYHLNPVEAESEEDIDISSGDKSESDILLDIFFQTTWRPLYFADMINDNRYDFNKFKPEWGLFPDRENQKISIYLDRIRYAAEYAEVTRIKTNTFSFRGTDLRIEVINKNRLAATYYVNGTQISTYFTSLGEDLGEIIERETNRREKLYNAFYSQGTLLTSSAYGTIRLEEDMEFSWDGNEKLVPLVIQKKGYRYGKIRFPYYLNRSLKTKYDGIITLLFNNYPVKEGINFLYQFVESGVKLYHLNNNNIDELLVVSEASNQFILFFSFKDE